MDIVTFKFMLETFSARGYYFQAAYLLQTRVQLCFKRSEYCGKETKHLISMYNQQTVYTITDSCN